MHARLWGVGAAAVLVVVAAVVLLGAALAGGTITAHGAGHEAEVRITAQRLTSGRTEFALQQRGADGVWGERQLPRARFFPAAPTVGRWLSSTPLTVRAAGAGDGSAGAEVRITAQRLISGRTEFALQQRGADGAWGEHQLTRARFFPPAPTVGRWLSSTPLTVRLPEPGWIDIEPTLSDLRGLKNCPVSALYYANESEELFSGFFLRVSHPTYGWYWGKCLERNGVIKFIDFKVPQSTMRNPVVQWIPLTVMLNREGVMAMAQCNYLMNGHEDIVPIRGWNYCNPGGTEGLGFSVDINFAKLIRRNSNVVEGKVCRRNVLTIRVLVYNWYKMLAIYHERSDFGTPSKSNVNQIIGENPELVDAQWWHIDIPIVFDMKWFEVLSPLVVNEVKEDCQ